MISVVDYSNLAVNKIQHKINHRDHRLDFRLFELHRHDRVNKRRPLGRLILKPIVTSKRGTMGKEKGIKSSKSD